MKPMSQDEALRIIQNVASHNPHDVPRPAEIVVAVATLAEREDYERTLTRTALDLICGAAEVTELVKKRVFHEHELSYTKLMESINTVRVACKDIEMLVRMGS